MSDEQPSRFGTIARTTVSLALVVVLLILTVHALQYAGAGAEADPGLTAGDMWPDAIAMVLTAAVVLRAIKYAPGRVGRR